MKKIINDPNAFVDEALDGILAAHPTMLKAVSADRRAIARADAPIEGHVGIVTGAAQAISPFFLATSASASAPRSRSGTCSPRRPLNRSSRQPEQRKEARAFSTSTGITAETS